MTHLNLDIKPHHVQRGNKASRRAQELKRQAQATPMPAKPAQRNSGPFKGSGKAMADLTSALGYPPAVIPPMQVSRRHQALPDDED